MDGGAFLRPEPRIVTVTARLAHCRALARSLRAADRAEIQAQGVKPVRLLCRLYAQSHIRNTVFVDGEIAAMWGCFGTFLSIEGAVWLYTAPPVERVPLGFLRAARRGIDMMLRAHRVLLSDVAADYERSIRFMKMLGFHVAAPRAEGPKGAMFCRLTLER
jgi:hypothetical protein